MIRHSSNGTLYYFNLKNRSVTMKNGNVIKIIFVGERIHESDAVFTEDDFINLINRLGD